MILITDSGSTKCDWIALDASGNEIFRTRTKGLNPAILSLEELQHRIVSNDVLSTHKDAITEIYFYGAGCGTDGPRRTLQETLENLFLNANSIQVLEDTYAAVYACIGRESGVVCILGTGSNCSFAENGQLEQRIVSLGYTLMDDASGNWFGKQLLRDYTFYKMPEHLRRDFANKYDLDADVIKHNLYREVNPNAYLAHFAEYIFSHTEEKYIKKIMRKGFRLFSKTMIMQYEDKLKEHQVHFAGSIAHFGAPQLRQVAEEMDYEVGNIVRRPIEGLLEYHKNLILS